MNDGDGIIGKQASDHLAVAASFGLAVGNTNALLDDVQEILHKGQAVEK